MIAIHVACEDEAFRAVVAEFLARQRDMCVLRADMARAAADRAEAPDVVVFGIPPRSEVTSHAREYRGLASTGAAIVAFCTSPQQAAGFEDLGVEYVVDADEPARELAAAVRAAYRDRSGHAIH